MTGGAACLPEPGRGGRRAVVFCCVATGETGAGDWRPEGRRSQSAPRTTPPRTTPLRTPVPVGGWKTAVRKPPLRTTHAPQGVSGSRGPDRSRVNRRSNPSRTNDTGCSATHRTPYLQHGYSGRRSRLAWERRRREAFPNRRPQGRCSFGGASFLAPSFERWVYSKLGGSTSWLFALEGRSVRSLSFAPCGGDELREGETMRPPGFF